MFCPVMLLLRRVMVGDSANPRVKNLWVVSKPGLELRQTWIRTTSPPQGQPDDSFVSLLSEDQWLRVVLLRELERDLTFYLFMF